MPITASMVACGMIFLGLRDSSPYMAADSKPTHDQNAKNRPMPAAPATAIVDPGLLGSATLPLRLLNALIGLSEASDQPSGPPPVNSTVSTIRLSITTSDTRKTPRMRSASVIL